MINIKCPVCSKEYNLPDETLGKRGKCTCGEMFEVKPNSNPQSGDINPRINQTQGTQSQPNGKKSNIIFFLIPVIVLGLTTALVSSYMGNKIKNERLASTGATNIADVSPIVDKTQEEPIVQNSKPANRPKAKQNLKKSVVKNNDNRTTESENSTQKEQTVKSTATNTSSGRTYTVRQRQLMMFNATKKFFITDSGAEQTKILDELSKILGVQIIKEDLLFYYSLATTLDRDIPIDKQVDTKEFRYKLYMSANTGKKDYPLLSYDFARLKLFFSAALLGVDEIDKAQFDDDLASVKKLNPAYKEDEDMDFIIKRWQTFFEEINP